MRKLKKEIETTLELAPGAVLDLGEEEKAHDINLGRPNVNFSSFVEAVCQQIGAALEIPYELLIKHFAASYSASRGALEEAWKMFKIACVHHGTCTHFHNCLCQETGMGTSLQGKE